MSGDRWTKLFWKLHLKPRTVSELKVALNMEQFSAGPINEAVPSFEILTWVYMEGDGRHSEYFSIFSTHKVFAFMVFALSRILETMITSQLLKVAMTKSSVILSVMYYSNETFFAFLVSRPPQSTLLHCQAPTLLLNRWLACLTPFSS